MSLRALTIALLLASASTIAFAAHPHQQAPPPSAPAVPPITAQAPVPAGSEAQRQETHGDWTVICASQNNRKVCAASQQLTDKGSGRRILGIEVRAATAGSAIFTMLLPFGLAVDKPLTIRIDEGAPMTMPFKTCIQVGCVATATWESTIVAALRKGTAATIHSLAADTGKDVVFRVSLNGFGTALDRTVVLSDP